MYDLLFKQPLFGKRFWNEPGTKLLISLSIIKLNALSIPRYASAVVCKCSNLFGPGHWSVDEGIHDILFHKAELMKMSIDGLLWRTKLCRKWTNMCACLLLTYFKQSLIVHNRSSPWLWFVFETGVTFLETSKISILLISFAAARALRPFLYRFHKMALITFFFR